MSSTADIASLEPKDHPPTASAVAAGMDNVADRVDTQCPACSGESMLLGRHARQLHLRCRRCGWVFAVSIPPDG